MISPERLRRYPFFGFLDDQQLKAVAMIAEEEDFEAGATLLEEGATAGVFYLLESGSIDLYFTLYDELRRELKREISVGEINPGEPFGISALIEPHRFTATARASVPSRVIQIDGMKLRDLCVEDQGFGYQLMRQIAKTALERLNATRVQLAAAWA